jgi:hypothetical protein
MAEDSLKLSKIGCSEIAKRLEVGQGKKENATGI